LQPGAGRPPRRYYTVTPAGRAALAEILERGKRT
jgi:DNA-binding PadR family transcriptional regulator